MGMAAWGDTGLEVAIGLGMAKTGLCGLSGSSTLMANGAPQATDNGLLGVLPPETGPEVFSTVQDNSS